jgi:hypothetical protein
MPTTPALVQKVHANTDDEGMLFVSSVALQITWALQSTALVQKVPASLKR